jgi:polar amino acid transport system substrate-binding protein
VGTATEEDATMAFRTLRARGTAALVTMALVAVGCSSTPAATGGASAGASGGGAMASLPSSATIDAVKQAGTLKVGYAPALPWLGQDTKTNEWFGPNDLLGRKLAEKLGVKLDPVTQTFDQLVPAVQAGTIDVALSPMFITEKRLEAIDMVPWTDAGTCYLIRKDETRFKTTQDFNSPDVTITGFVGTGTTQQIQKAYPNAKLNLRQQAPGEEVNYIPVQQNQADAAPFDSPLAAVYANKFPDLKVFPDGCLLNPDLPTPIGIGIKKGDTGLAQVLTDLIKELQPEIQAELTKYSDPQYLSPSS